MATRQIPLDWDALETAVERNAADTESFLNLKTGHVVTIVQGDPEAAILKQQVADNIRDYIRVEPASSREQYRWMERFVSSVPDDALRERLVISIDGKGAFRRFKDVLLAYPAERERWFGYRADLLHWHISNWLQENQLEAATEPPWGEIKPPPDLPKVATRPVPQHPDSPGEALRRQARELIDSITAIELPTAIAFLEFLKERGTAALQSAPAAGKQEGAARARRRETEPGASASVPSVLRASDG